MDKSGTKRLVIEIVLQALHDYEKAEAILKRFPNSRRAKERIEEIEEFFESEWFQTLRALAPEIISEHILEDFKNDRKRISATSVSA